MKYGSVCSGIEAASSAWEKLGWKPLFFSEIEPFPAAVLAHHYPDVTNEGDFTQIGDKYDLTDGLIVGGTPCQDFSVAGLRAGLDGKRGNLSTDFIKLAFQSNATWLCWENVPGVLSSGGGQDFATILSGFTGCKINAPTEGWKNAGIISGADGCYSVAWRILDAQFVRVDGFERAVPQRRRRVFVVGYSGSWQYPAAVLFERESLQGNSPPCRKAGQGTAGDVAPSLTASNDPSRSPQSSEITQQVSAVLEATVGCLQARDYKGVGNQYVDEGKCVPEVCGCLSDGAHNGGGLNGQDAYTGRIIPVEPKAYTLSQHDDDRNNGLGDISAREDDMASTLMGGAGGQGKGKTLVAEPTDRHAVAFQRSELRLNGTLTELDIAPTLKAECKKGDTELNVAQSGMQVRRLLPTECERLMGFPDGHTAIPWRGKSAENCPDGPRYKALGNSMAVNCMRLIGMRIDMVDKIAKGSEQ